jgi:hypothetical protein
VDELLSVLFCSGSVGVSHDGTRLGKKRDGGKERREKTDRTSDRTSRESMEELVFFLKCLMREESKT